MSGTLLPKIYKNFSKSLPEDGFNTRNHAGYDSRHLYLHISKTEIANLFPTRCGRSCVERQENRIKMQYASEQPAKRQRLTGPPKHSESFKLMIKMTWWKKRLEKQAEAYLMLDSGATGPVLSTRWIQAHQIPCTKWKHPEPITDRKSVV